MHGNLKSVLRFQRLQICLPVLSREGFQTCHSKEAKRKPLQCMVHESSTSVSIKILYNSSPPLPHTTVSYLHTFTNHSCDAWLQRECPLEEKSYQTDRQTDACAVIDVRMSVSAYRRRSP